MTGNEFCGVTPALVLAALTIGVFGFFVCRRTLPLPLAVLLATVKVLLPFVYFGWFYNEDWNFLDDIVYFEGAVQLQQLGYNPISVLLESEGRDKLLELANGSHTLYLWFNLVSHCIYGLYYYAPVFVNVGLTFVVSLYLFKIACACGFTTIYTQGLQVLFLLHWEVLAWSSLINLKDILVMALCVIMLYNILRLTRSYEVRSLVEVLLILPLFIFIRLYIPFLIVLALALWSVLYVEGRRKIYLFCLVGMGAAVVVGFYGLSTLMSFSAGGNLGQLLQGMFRFTLTPQPWSLEIGATFLLVPATLHWVMFVPAVIGAYQLFRCSRGASLLLINLFVIIVFYGFLEDIQGVRQRLQAIPVIAWCQYHFFWWFVGATGLQLAPQLRQRASDSPLLPSFDPAPALAHSAAPAFRTPESVPFAPRTRPEPGPHGPPRTSSEKRGSA